VFGGVTGAGVWKGELGKRGGNQAQRRGRRCSLKKKEIPWWGGVKPRSDVSRLPLPVPPKSDIQRVLGPATVGGVGGPPIRGPPGKTKHPPAAMKGRFKVPGKKKKKQKKRIGVADQGRSKRGSEQDGRPGPPQKGGRVA